MISNNGILYMEPSKNVSLEATIDTATRKMTAALREGKAGPAWRGTHFCACGAQSSNCDYTLPNGDKTNSLSVHYLAYHRSEVSDEQMERVMGLEYGEAEPTEREMKAGMRAEAAKEPSTKPESLIRKEKIGPQFIGLPTLGGKKMR